MTSGKSFFVLVTAGTEANDGCALSSRRTAISRLERGFWELFARTPNRDHVMIGDHLVIYATRASRREGGAFIGMAVVNEVIRDLKKIRQTVNTEYKPAWNSAVLLRLEKVSIFTTPVSIDLVRDRLSFIPKHNKWGVVFLGGCVRINAADFNVITESTNNSASKNT